MIVRQSLLITFLFLYTHAELAHIFVANSEVALGSILELRISTVLAAGGVHHIVEGVVLHGDDRHGVAIVAGLVVVAEEVALVGTVIDRVVDKRDVLDIALAYVEEVATVASDTMDLVVAEDHVVDDRLVGVAIEQALLVASTDDFAVLYIEQFVVTRRLIVEELVGGCIVCTVQYEVAQRERSTGLQLKCTLNRRFGGGIYALDGDRVLDDCRASLDLQHSLTALSYLDVAHVDILNDAASTVVGLDAQHTLEIGRVHHAILGEDILTASGNLRSDDNGPMSVLHLAVADDDISGGFLPESAVVVASALDGNAVVTGVERAVFDDNVLAGFRIAAVAVGPFVPYLHIVDGDAF